MIYCVVFFQDGKIIVWNLNGDALCEVDCKTADKSFLDKNNSSGDGSQPHDTCQPPTESSADVCEHFSVKKCTFLSKLNILCVCFYK